MHSLQYLYIIIANVPCTHWCISITVHSDTDTPVHIVPVQMSAIDLHCTIVFSIL